MILRLKDEWVYVDGKKTDLGLERTGDGNLFQTYQSYLNWHIIHHPDIHFDLTKEKGHPFAYHVYGTAIITVTIDCLRGIYEFDSVKVVHDFGNSMNPYG